MSSDDFTDAALVLVGHGSTRHPRSAEAVRLQANLLRARNLFAEVRECFWQVEPSVDGVLAQTRAERVFVVPFFTSEGYFTRQVLPRALGLRLADGWSFPLTQRLRRQFVCYCPPVGSHPSITGALLARAEDAVSGGAPSAGPQPEEIALFLAGHGTGRNSNSRRAVEQQVQRIRALRRYAEVHGVFLEEPPGIGDCYRLARVRNIVLVPFFLSDGLHAREDIPVLLGEPASVVRDRLSQHRPAWLNPTERHGRRVWYAQSLSGEPGLTEVILDVVKEAARVAGL
jgi:sirohydrochlorin cobaltochelatase